MLTERTVAEGVRAAGIDAPTHFHQVLGSTNSELLALAERGAPEWTVVAAGQQVAGRGRLGRAWVSAPGSSLIVSVLLRSDLPPADAALMTLAAGASLAAALGAACGVAAGCKWPNDLVAGGRKLGGILTEAKVENGRLAHVVVGTGVNVLQARDDFPPALRDTATSVVLEGGRPDASALLSGYLSSLRSLCDTATGGLGAAVLEAYRERCDTVGRVVRATTTTGSAIQGLAVGVGDGGELLVQTDAGTESVAFGEVEHVR